MTHNKFLKITIPVFMIGLTMACSKSMHGKYADSYKAVVVDFQSGSKALLTTGMGIGPTVQMNYKVDGDKVILEAPSGSGNLVLTIEKDGSLSGAPGLGGNLRRQGS